MLRLFSLSALIGLAAMADGAFAHENEVDVRLEGAQLCVTSNSSPNHDIGQFPNRGNPNSFRQQATRVCVDADPEVTGRITQHTQSSGVSVTGILFRPGTADFYDANSPRGFSRDPSSGWRLEGMGAAELLGMDAQNAHVDHRGLYHYHGVSEAPVGSQSGSLIGWAADGFEIHYIGDSAQSGWQLREGRRASAPFGAYDGTYEQDWVFVEGAGNLDQCNAAVVNGTLTYFATDTYPFFPRCFHGTVSSDFMGRR